MKLTVSAFVFSCALAACFSYGLGHDINFADAQRLTPGVSTRADAEQIFGAPNGVNMRPDGNTDIIWMYVHSVAYGPNGTKTLSLTFDRDGKYVGIFGQTSTGSDVGQPMAPAPAPIVDAGMVHR